MVVGTYLCVEMFSFVSFEFLLLVVVTDYCCCVVMMTFLILSTVVYDRNLFEGYGYMYSAASYATT